MASTDATAIPVKNQAYRLTIPIWDADGDLVTGATGLDSEVSKDAGTFADCTNEATEIATASGIYYLDLTSTEMNADTVAIIVKTTSSGAKTTPIILYPQEAGDIQVNLTYWNGTAVATPDTAGYPKVTIKDGTGTGELDTASGVVLARDHTGAALATPTNITAGTITTVTNLTNAPTSGDLTATMKTSVTTAATAATPALSATGVQAIWDALTSVLTTAGSVGKVIADFLTGNAFTRLGAPVGASISADVAAVQADTDNIQTRIPAALVSGRIDSSVGAIAANAITAASMAADASAEIADQVWDEVLADHLTSGTTGAGLNAAGAAGDPWSTALPGAYGAGTAGKIIGDNINATISGRASQTSVDTIDDFLDTEIAAILAAVDTEVAAIKAKTDNLPSDPADASDIAASFSTVNSTLATIAGYVDTEVASVLAAVDTEVAAIKAKTDNLPASPANEATLTTIAGYLDTEVAAILAAVDTEVGAIKAKTDLIPAAPAAVADIPTAIQNADALLNRDMSAVSDTTARSPLNALRFLRNKWSTPAGVLTVTKENDSTTAWTAALTSDAAAEPITGSDPT